jgi:hypothetical protein
VSVRHTTPEEGHARAAARCRRPPSLTATLPEFHAGRPPRNKGMRYPADPPTIEEIATVMRRAGDGVHGRRLRGLIVVLWRAGLRIHEALALAETGPPERTGVSRPRSAAATALRAEGFTVVGTRIVGPQRWVLRGGWLVSTEADPEQAEDRLADRVLEFSGACDMANSPPSSLARISSPWSRRTFPANR